MPPRRSLLRRRRRGCQRRAKGRFLAACASVGAGELTCMFWSRLGGSAGVYRPSVPRRDLAAPRQSALVRASTHDWSSTQGSVPAHAPASSDPQQPHRPANTRASPSARPSARAHGPKTQSRKGTRPRTRQPPTRAPQSARLVAESPREIAGPTGRRRRRANAAFESPRPTLTRTAPNSRLTISSLWASR